jgi:8-oxo-dGTP diphosphatase
VYLVRHARAGRRQGWKGPDDLRPLSKVGRRQSERIVAAFDDRAIERIVSSPYVRCRQTVEPLAARLQRPVEVSDALAEGASALDAVRLVEKVSDRPTVLCTHGDVIEAVLQHLDAQGVPLKDDRRFPKGSTWVLHVVAGDIRGGRYEPPPD